jgi:hypothetical protein
MRGGTSLRVSVVKEKILSFEVVMYNVERMKTFEPEDNVEEERPH